MPRGLPAARPDLHCRPGLAAQREGRPRCPCAGLLARHDDIVARMGRSEVARARLQTPPLTTVRAEPRGPCALRAESRPLGGRMDLRTRPVPKRPLSGVSSGSKQLDLWKELDPRRTAMISDRVRDLLIEQVGHELSVQAGGPG